MLNTGTPSDVLRLGLDKLSDYCALRRINSPSKHMKMPLTKAQVEKYADCYKGLSSNVPDPDGGSARWLCALEADQWLSRKLEGAAQAGMTVDALEAVATWKYRGGALRKLVRENPARGNDELQITKKAFDPHVALESEGSERKATNSALLRGGLALRRYGPSLHSVLT